MSEENPVPHHSTSETPRPALGAPASLDELLGVIRAAVKAKVASVVDRLSSQQPPSSAAPGKSTASTGTCSGTAIRIVGAFA